MLVARDVGEGDAGADVAVELAHRKHLHVIEPLLPAHLERDLTCRYGPPFGVGAVDQRAQLDGAIRDLELGEGSQQVALADREELPGLRIGEGEPAVALHEQVRHRGMLEPRFPQTLGRVDALPRVAVVGVADEVQETVAEVAQSGQRGEDPPLEVDRLEQLRALRHDLRSAQHEVPGVVEAEVEVAQNRLLGAQPK